MPFWQLFDFYTSLDYALEGKIAIGLTEILQKYCDNSFFI